MNKVGPIIPNAEKMEGDALSPMDPPDALSPPSLDAVDKETLHPFLKDLMSEHQNLVAQLDQFEKAIVQIMEEGITQAINKTIRDFFEFFDQEFLLHNQKEESLLFPVLQDKLRESAKPAGHETKTPVDILLADHVEASQLAAVSFNLFGLVTKLEDKKSKLVVLDLAIEQGKALVELMRVHIFREDNIVFPLAQKKLTEGDFTAIKSRLEIK